MSGLSENPTSKAWGDAEKQAWLERQELTNSYAFTVLKALINLPPAFRSEQYGSLSNDPKRYPLMRVVPTAPQNDRPAMLITGGVHGYEPSGIIGALRFVKEMAPEFSDQIDFYVYPCVSPFAYEIDHRWNAKAMDPNRHFRIDSPTEETLQFMQSAQAICRRFAAAIDLHETVERDLELIAERHARDGTMPEPGDDYIPKGYYVCVPNHQDVHLGQKIVEAVSNVTPVCPDPTILGIPNNKGVIMIGHVPGLCQNFTRTISDFSMTTEIYPDGRPKGEAEAAQLASIRRVIQHVLAPANG